MLITALSHFDQDITRSRQLLEHADTLPVGVLQRDIRRSAWMMSVGALDAYFCDAYADTIARVLRAREIQTEIEIPERLQNLRVPVIAIIRSNVNESWRWRIAARELIESDTVLSLEKIKSLFNQFFRGDHKLFGATSFDSWLVHPTSRHGLFGVSKNTYRKLTGSAKNTQRKKVKEKFEERFQLIFQRRHDCIHNCDRPKISITKSMVNKSDPVEKVIIDIEFLVHRFNADLTTEFPIYLRLLGFNGVTRNRVGA